MYNNLFEEMLGKTFDSVTNINDEEIVFKHKDGGQFILRHEQDCCESVWVEDIVGELSDLEGTPILMAEESTNYDDDPPENPYNSEYEYESYTWTYYRFATMKGYVTIRFFGTSNGYYSETAALYYIPKREYLS